MKDLLSRFNQNRTKIVAPYMNHLICSLLLLLTIFLQLVATKLAMEKAFHFYHSSSLLSSSYSLTKTMPRRFQGPGKRRHGGSKKHRYFFKIPKGQHELVREYKVGFLFYKYCCQNMFIWAVNLREFLNQPCLSV